MVGLSINWWLAMPPQSFRTAFKWGGDVHLQRNRWHTHTQKHLSDRKRPERAFLQGFCVIKPTLSLEERYVIEKKRNLYWSKSKYFIKWYSTHICYCAPSLYSSSPFVGRYKRHILSVIDWMLCPWNFVVPHYWQELAQGLYQTNKYCGDMLHPIR